MRRAIHVDSSELAVRDLLGMLHHGASADEFAARLAELDALPASYPGKSALVDAVRMAMAVRNRLELQEQRERGLLAVIASAQDLSSRLDLPELLAAIVSRARNLLGSDVAWLSTYDAEAGEFHVLVVDGALSQGPAAMVARRDHGVAGLVMSTRLPFTTPDYLHDKRFAHEGKLDDTFREEGLAALVGVPLIWGGDVIGLLFVADRYHRMHTAQSTSILCTLATYAAVALKNARDFERVNAALAHADEARAELERHLASVQAGTDAHEQITSLLASGASLATLCQAMAQLLGGSVVVLDETGVVVAGGAAQAIGIDASMRPIGAHASDITRAAGASRATGRSVVAYDAAGETCRALAVIGGNDVLGTALLLHRGSLDDVAVRTFERSCSAIGVVLLSQHRAEASRNRSASELLRSLVSPRQDDLAVLADRAGQHGIDLARPLALIVVEMDRPRADYAARRFGQLALPANAVADDIDGALIVLCGASAAHEVRQAVSSWVGGDLKAVHRGVVSRPVAQPAELPALYAALRRALAVLGRIGVQGRIVGQHALAVYSTLFETHDRASLASFLDATIGPLLAHDEKRGSDLAATLLAWFDCNQNARTAAQRLGIHVNTVRQRLTTIEDLLGHLGHASRALELHIALRLWSLSTPARFG
jgi:sugar diacid utilization regulator